MIIIPEQRHSVEDDGHHVTCSCGARFGASSDAARDDAQHHLETVKK